MGNLLVYTIIVSVFKFQPCYYNYDNVVQYVNHYATVTPSNGPFWTNTLKKGMDTYTCPKLWD